MFIVSTWSKEHGLTLYVNGKESAATMDTIEVQARTAEKSSKITVGKENTGTPNTYAKLTSSLFVLFDQHVTITEATKIYTYYWGHCKCFIIH